MYREKSHFGIISVTKDIIVVGKSLQHSGLPIDFDSLGTMWTMYTEEIRTTTPNCVDPHISYGVCLNTIPDYIVGVEASIYQEDTKDFQCFTIPSGKYLKVEYNGKDHNDLVNIRLPAMLNETMEWAKEHKIDIDGEFLVEVYPDETFKREYPEMYSIYPLL